MFPFFFLGVEMIPGVIQLQQDTVTVWGNAAIFSNRPFQAREGKRQSKWNQTEKENNQKQGRVI